MYLTTHRVARIRKPGDPPYPRAETSVHGFLYTHGPEFSVVSADLDEVTTRNPGGELTAKLIGGLKPGGNAVLSYVDVVAPDDVSRGTLSERLRAFSKLVDRAEQLPVETPTPQDVFLKYHISPMSYRAEVDWSDDFQQLADRALELFDDWKDGSAHINLIHDKHWHRRRLA